MERTGIPIILIIAAVFMNAEPRPILAQTSPAVATETMLISDFESGLDGWKSESGIGISVSKNAAIHGSGSLLVQKTSAPEIVLSKKTHADLSVWKEYRFDVFVSGRTRSIQLIAGLKDVEYAWYQDRNIFPLKSGWNNISIPVSGVVSRLEPRGHYRPWDGYVAQDIREFVIKLINATGTPFSACIDHVRLERNPSSAPAPAPPPEIRSMRVSSLRPLLYGLFEITFDIPRIYPNPFDPDIIDVTAVFTSPSGAVAVTPGFYSQDYIRSLENGKEKLTPAGSGFWRVRFCPVEQGSYRYRIIAKEHEGEARSREYSFIAVPASDDGGFVRVSKKDNRYFEFENGRFFYPIGMNIVSPSDTPYGQKYISNLPDDLNTYAYDRYFKDMKSCGMNFVRIWMAHWWLALEWNRDTGPFQGIGRYSQQNAWRLDHILEEARNRDIYILLTINNHTQLTSYNRGWEDNPYNQENGGWLRSGGQFFTDAKARESYKKKMRYIIARWGYSRNIFAWDHWSEIDLTMNFDPGSVRQWFLDIARYVRDLDPNKHLQSVHFCQYGNTSALGDLPEMDFVHSNAYTNVGLPDAQDEAIISYYKSMQSFHKPVLVSEFGGHWAGSPHDIMKRDLHTGLWAGYMTPLAAAPLFWWWNLVDDDGLYPDYAGISSFAEDEDPRGRDLSIRDVSCSGSDRITARCLANSDSAYVWIYDFYQALRIPCENRMIRAAVVRIPDIEEGRYRIEYRRTRGEKPSPTPGELITEKENDKIFLTVRFPDFTGDMACKIRKIQ